MATKIRTSQTNLDTQSTANLLPNSNFINNSTNGYGSTPDDWTSSSANHVQGGFPAMTKQNLIDLLGVSDGDIEGLWNLNEASGNAVDLSSNGYTLTDTNTVGSSDDGLMAKARDFELSANEKLTIANASSANLNMTGTQTWGCWIKAESIGNYMHIMSKRTADPYIRWLLVDNTNHVDFRLLGLTTTPQITSDVKIEAGKWYFIVGVYDSTNSKIKVWVNGIKKEATASGASTANSGDFYVGGAVNGEDFDGLIQNAFVLSVALTDLQVKRLFAATLYRGQKIRRATTNAKLSTTLTEDKVERLRGKTITMSAKMWQEVASTGTLAISDGSDYTSSTIATTGSWVDVSITSTISATATSITFGLNNAVSDGNVWFKEVMLNYGSTAIPWTSAPEDWARFPRLLRMDIPECINLMPYQYEENRWYTLTSTLTGFSSIGNATYRAMYSGKMVSFVPVGSQLQGTSNATTFTFTLPIYITGNNAPVWTPCFVEDGGTYQTVMGGFNITNGAGTATVVKTFPSGAWTNSGAKALYSNVFSYEID